MRIQITVMVFVVACLVAVAQAGAQESEKKVSISEVPAKVKAAILKAVGDGKLVDIGEFTKEGEKVYEIEMVVDGEEFDVLFASDGKVLKKASEGPKGEEKTERAEKAEKPKKSKNTTKSKAAKGDVTKTGKKVALPEAVAKAFKAAFPKAEIEKLDAEEENGVMVYDFEFKNGDVEQETDIAADGTVLEVTLVITAKDLPKPARKAIKKSAGGAQLGRIERIDIRYETKDGKVVKLANPVTHYAAEYSAAGKVKETVVTADGTIVEE